MNYYYVNDRAQANGDHEVHKAGCSFMPVNKTSLGQHSNCYDAVKEAKKSYGQSNGCYYCNNACHTS